MTSEWPNRVHGLPAHPTARGADARVIGDLARFVFEITDERVAFARGSQAPEQLPDQPGRSHHRDFAACGDHPAIIRFNMPVAAASARSPEGVSR